MNFGPDASMPVSQWLLMWGLIIVVLVGLAYGLSLGVAFSGIAVFILAGAAALFALYIILSRIYRLAMYGTLSAPDSSSGSESSGGDRI